MSTSSAVASQMGTFQLEETLPPLPLPPLEKTLQRYLESTKLFLTVKEFENTKRIVAEFERGVGQDLHRKLQERARTHKNWVEQWWEDYAYLAGRAPLAVQCNISGVTQFYDNIWPPMEGTQCKRAAIFAWYILDYFQKLRREEIPVDKSRTGKAFSMIQYRAIFNCTRIPGETQDQLIQHFKTEREGPCPNHVVVLSNGHIFVIRPIDNKDRLMPAEEINRQLIQIKKLSSTRGQGIGVLTADDRSSFAKNSQPQTSQTSDTPSTSVAIIVSPLIALMRDQVKALKERGIEAAYVGDIKDKPILYDKDRRSSMSQAYKHLKALDPLNRSHLDIIEKSVFLIMLDDGTPNTSTDLMDQCFKGDIFSRWHEKVYGFVVFRNGTIAFHGDHAPIDGITIVELQKYVLGYLLQNAGRWPVSHFTGISNNQHPKELIFTIDETIVKAMDRAFNTFTTNANNLQIISSKCDVFGKQWTKKHKLHPDTVFQMALQLAYFTLHHKPVATYETATMRQFYHGRTETVRVCTTESVQWCQAMFDPSKSISERRALFMAAMKKHDENMVDACNAEGCDRHLFGLQVLAMEQGIPMPELYTDPAYVKSGGGGNFQLSTSCAGYTGCVGAVAPMCEGGYGVFYAIMNDSFLPCILTFKSSKETKLEQFFVALNASLADIQNLVMMDNSKM